MLMTEGLGIEAGREARPANFYAPGMVDVKIPISTYNGPPQHHAQMHSSHPHVHHAPVNTSMNKSTGGGQGEIPPETYFFNNMIPNYGQVNVNVSNGEEGYPDFLTASPSHNLALSNSSDFLNM
jgi:hypothetical protein